MDSVGQSEPVRLAVYNAGTDVYEGDPLGLLNVSAEHVQQRDLYVVEQLRQREIPVVMLLSGGYSRRSYQLVFNSVDQFLRRFGTVKQNTGR